MAVVGTHIFFFYCLCVRICVQECGAGVATWNSRCANFLHLVRSGLSPFWAIKIFHSLNPWCLFARVCVCVCTCADSWCKWCAIMMHWEVNSCAITLLCLTPSLCQVQMKRCSWTPSMPTSPSKSHKVIFFFICCFLHERQMCVRLHHCSCFTKRNILLQRSEFLKGK